MLNLFYVMLFHINYGDLITINVKFSIVSLQNHINNLKRFLSFLIKPLITL